MNAEKHYIPTDRPTSSIRNLFSSTNDLLYLGLACPQIWLNFMFQSLNDYAPMSTEIFYASRGLFLLVIAVVFFVKKYSADVTWGFLSWLIIPLMTMAPFIAIMPLPPSF